MDIKIKCFDRRLALDVINNTSSAHIDYFHDDGTVELTVNNVKSITHDDKTEIYYIVLYDGYGFGIAYMAYYQIVIC